MACKRQQQSGKWPHPPPAELQSWPSPLTLSLASRNVVSPQAWTDTSPSQSNRTNFSRRWIGWEGSDLDAGAKDGKDKKDGKDTTKPPHSKVATPVFRS